MSLLFAGGFYLLTHDHGDEILFLNNHHYTFSDLFFRYTTMFGEEIPWILTILVCLLFVSYRHFLISVSTLILSSLVVQIPKRTIFSDCVRPEKYFKGKVILKIVENVEVRHYNSFPSGHAGSAFALAFFIIIYSKNKKLGLISFFMATIVAISRMYLIQHFLVDVYFGAFLGTMSSIIIYYIFEKYFPTDKYAKLNNALLIKKS